LEREGVRRDGGPGRLFSTFSDEVDRDRFVDRTREDPHHFRLILSPENGSGYPDLKGFTREILARIEWDLDTILDWVAADHYDTGRPHVHVVIRGVTENGRALHIAGDYLNYGISHHMSEVLTRDLGLQLEVESEPQFARHIDADRFTRLDQLLIDRAADGLIDFTSWNVDAEPDRIVQQQLIARMRCLDRMGLATQQGHLKWHLSPNASDVLREMDRSAIRIDAIHRAVDAANLTRPAYLYRIHDHIGRQITGSVLAHDQIPDLPQRNYVVLDGVDGRVHFVDTGRSETALPLGSIIRISPNGAAAHKADRRIAEIAAANGGRYDTEIHLRSDRAATVAVGEAHTRRLEAISRVAGPLDRNADGSWTTGAKFMDVARRYERSILDARPVAIDILSKLPLSRQVNAEGATWLDHQLAGMIPSNQKVYGFGRDVHEALLGRQQWLIEQGFARRDGDRVVYRDKLPERLMAREVQQIARMLEGQLHKPFADPSACERAEGVFRQTMELTSGRFALLEKSYEFTLVPWKPEMDRYLGKRISGVAVGGDYEWGSGKNRGLSV